MESLSIGLPAGERLPPAELCGGGDLEVSF